jgi:tetratricopeptide (TPR) repeat protein
MLKSIVQMVFFSFWICFTRKGREYLSAKSRYLYGKERGSKAQKAFVQLVEESLKANPRNAFVRLDYARYLRKRRKYSEAITHLGLCIEYDPLLLAAVLEKAECHEECKDFASALKMYQEYLKMRKKSSKLTYVSNLFCRGSGIDVDTHLNDKDNKIREKISKLQARQVSGN